MSRGKVLVVDDEPEIVKALEIRLSNNGYDVVTATDGEQAINEAKKELPDLIILDICMSYGNGHIVAQNLSRFPDTANIPIIFLTAKVTEVDFRMALDEGAAKYITKPFKSAELMSSVEEVINREER